MLQYCVQILHNVKYKFVYEIMIGMKLFYIYATVILHIMTATDGYKLYNNRKYIHYYVILVTPN